MNWVEVALNSGSSSEGGGCLSELRNPIYLYLSTFFSPPVEEPSFHQILRGDRAQEVKVAEPSFQSHEWGRCFSVLSP